MREVNCICSGRTSMYKEQFSRVNDFKLVKYAIPLREDAPFTVNFVILRTKSSVSKRLLSGSSALTVSLKFRSGKFLSQICRFPSFRQAELPLKVPRVQPLQAVPAAPAGKAKAEKATSSIKLRSSCFKNFFFMVNTPFCGRFFGIR